MTAITERTLIARLVADLPRSTHQLNRVHESDAELIRIPGSDTVLAITTDGVAEEIQAGLYSDPFLAGWMSVAVNASDLAAVGAEPLGMLVSESIPPDMPENDLARLQQGIGASASAHRLPILGGDTNASPTLQITGTAIGTLAERWTTRLGASVGDHAFASGPLGLGSAFAFAQLMRHGKEPVAYQPTARLPEGRVVARWASACIDTSDGAIAAFDELMRLNEVGIRLDRSIEQAMHPAALAVARAAGLPAWTMFAGPHGEFELLFTVSPGRRDSFLADAATIGWRPVELGRVVAEHQLVCRIDEAWCDIDTAHVRNLFGAVGGDPQRYLQGLLRSPPMAAASSTAS